MRVWQRLNAPRNKREQRVAKIARDLERERILNCVKEWQCLEDFCSCWPDNNLCENRDIVIALIKGEK